jgi:hypothetical protein
LPIIIVGVIIVLACCLLLLSWANFLSTRSFGAMAVLPVLSLIGLVWRATALSCLVALMTVLLLVMNSTTPKHIGKSSNSIPVTSVKTITPELSQFSIRHLLGLFNLLRIELNLRRIDGVRATMAFGVTLFRWLHVTIIVIVLGWLGCGLTSSLAILLRNPTFELVNCTFLELLSHLLLLTEPGVFCLASFINISCMILRIRCLRMAL